MRILTITMGVLYAFASVWCFMNGGKTFLAFAFVIGMLMLMHGSAGVLVCSKIKRRSWNREYFLTESILAILLAVLVLSNRLIADLMVPVFFGMWLLFTGITRAVSVIRAGKDSEKMWAWKGGLSILAMAAGMYAFFNESLYGVGIAVIVGICIMVQGMNLIYTGIEIPKKSDRVKDISRRTRAMQKIGENL